MYVANAWMSKFLFIVCSDSQKPYTSIGGSIIVDQSPMISHYKDFDLLRILFSIGMGHSRIKKQILTPKGRLRVVVIDQLSPMPNQTREGKPLEIEVILFISRVKAVEELRNSYKFFE